VDANGRIAEAPGKRPILRNVSLVEIELFCQQMQVIDLKGCENQDAIAARIVVLSQSVATACSCSACDERPMPIAISVGPMIVATESDAAIPLDKAGYFVVVPLADKRLIHVEHYGYDNTPLHVIEGTTSRVLYTTIIANGWVTELSHAAYLGKELAKAELVTQARSEVCSGWRVTHSSDVASQT
jgi:tetrahydromethanopterin S-methyltransferase subunit A